MISLYLFVLSGVCYTAHCIDICIDISSYRTVTLMSMNAGVVIFRWPSFSLPLFSDLG